MSSVVDKPKLAGNEDLLGLVKYTEGLKKFIQTTETPITVGIQGEWGSGKTSLMNTLRDDLCKKPDAKFFDVWINTWEYSLLSSVDQTLVKIILGLIEDIGEISNKKEDEFFEKAISLGVGLLKLANTAGGLAGAAAGMAGDALEKKYLKESDATISQLRESLQNVINAATESGPKKKFVFFIDDLDRLDPTVAVSILELLKNIFDLNHCVFVIAVDYGVVIKGLKGKFGEMTESNEWEFRAFFDKIIQLPFTMPMSSYDLAKYLSSLLCQIGYFESKDLKNDETIDKITEIVDYTVGANPRSLKRLANSVSLIDIIRGESSLSVENKLIEFALICTQIAYPYIYNVILKNPNFVEWDLSFAKEQLRNKKIDITALDSLKETEDFDEDWEQALWYLCQSSAFLRERASSLSKLLTFIKENHKGKDFESDLERLLTASSVTNVSSDVGAKKQVNKVRHESWDGYQEFTLEKKYKTDSNLPEIMKSIHDDVRKLFEDEIKAEYTSERLSFKKVNASTRKQNFLVMTPRQTYFFVDFADDSNSSLFEAIKEKFPIEAGKEKFPVEAGKEKFSNYEVGQRDNGDAYIKIGPSFNFQDGAFKRFIEIAYNNID